MADWDIETDILIIGAGGCGLAAAIAAADRGADVAIVEKLERPGGNTAVSTGSLPGAGTRFQRAAGIEDSPELMIRDLTSLSGPHDVTDLTVLLSNRSAELVEWLADAAEVRLDIIRDYRHVGHSVPRLHAPTSRKGQDLTDDLLRAVERRGIPLALASPVTDLVVEDGAVIGAVAKAAGATIRIGARKVILGVNGFGADPEMVARYCPDVAATTYVGARGSEGEAVRWGLSLGARLGNMASWQGFATIIDPHGELLSWTTIEKGGIIVDASGERFGDEAIGYSGFAAPVAARPGPTIAILDQRIHDIAALEPWFEEVLDLGGARRADTVEDLAKATGLPLETLRRTLDDYARAASGEIADRHGRTDFGIAPLVAPYWWTRVKPALLSTQGGLMVDDHARVLGEDGRPIANLFAGGGAVAGISGRAGGVGYASGNGLLHAIGLGWIAGRAAAAELGA